MAIPTAKKRKKQKQQLTPAQRIKYLETQLEELKKQRLREFMLTVEMMEGIFITDMWTILGWKEKRIAERIFSHLVLFEEVADGRTTPVGILENTKYFSGLDLQQIFHKIDNGGEISIEYLQEIMKEARIRNKKEEENENKLKDTKENREL